MNTKGSARNRSPKGRNKRRAHDAGFCVVNMGRVTTPIVTTCLDLYVRFHGLTAAYAGGYSDADLKSWARKLT